MLSLFKIKKNIMEKIGFIEFQGKWLPQFIAKKNMEAIAVSSLKEAHQIFLELGSKLQSGKSN